MVDWTGKRVLILGAARQGQALARWLTLHDARVTLSDKRLATDLEPARQALADLPIEWALGGHPLELLDQTDVLCLSGGIPLTLPIVAEAQKHGIPLSNDTQIFMEAAPCKTVGITGSAGKTTTTALLGKMAEASYAEQVGRVFVGGNIGDPLINYVD
jgi:UDP-N-acetylmuramoylalanine--D-glutamate ligase